MNINIVKPVESSKTGDRIDQPYMLHPQIETFERGEYIRTNTNSEEDKSTIVYKFGEYEIEVKLDPEGRLLYINVLTPKQKKYYEELFCVDEEFPKRPLE
jgi:hypothetical protein